MSRLKFTKMSGAGNDFILFDCRKNEIPRPQRSLLAAHICRRMFSVGADGVIFIEASEQADFQWDFYNADGSVAEMCGNGARCAARYAHLNGIAGEKLSFLTLAGMIHAELRGDDVCLQMTAPEDFRTDLSVELDGENFMVDFLNTGVPHAVVYIEQGIETIPIKQWGREVRYHQLFAPAGTNVNFVGLDTKGELRVRTYERGVEDETMACGTGAVASALCIAQRDNCASPLTVISSGGEPLTIGFTSVQELSQAQPTLTGPARIIYEGELTVEALPEARQ